MYRVIIVDDEPWTLIGIRNAFNWDTHGFEIIAETTSSEEAFELICKNRPEIVFTDIKMPKYSGIDLMRMTRELGLDTEFVIISGFAEFSYAQEALKFGALDYCLKPINLHGTDELLKKAAAHFEKKQASHNNVVLEILIKKELNELPIAEPFFQEPANKFWYVVITYLESETNIGVIPAFLIEHKHLAIRMGSRKMLFIVNSNEQIDESVVQPDSSSWEQYISIGISSAATSYQSLPKLIKEADIAALQVFVTGKKETCGYKESVKLLKPSLAILLRALEQKELEAAYAAFEKIMMEFKASSYGMMEAVYLWNQIVGTLAMYFDEDCCTVLEYLNYSELHDRFESFDSLCKFLNEVFKQLEQQNNIPVNENENLHYFEQLVKYIDSHYDQELYLKDLAAKFYMNQFHCSRLFKKVLGKTFSEYVQGIRISKASQLIRGTNLSIEEIAQKVGYSDYFYFSKVFKKEFGITPAKYRKM